MQKNFKMNKAGVSLIAVLLFMLIATIAATATWKWITSEGFSSTSRMLKREAYQSSIAGIENARSWMTYHANDVGALIKQYIDGGNTPINLDAQLKPLQRAGQNYHVWLTGVNVEGTTYKLKVYSSGNARGSAKHNEVAIFNVDGLYRINIPEEHIHRAIDFDYNYFGGSTTNHGDIFARSMLVNGDLLDGNPASIDSNLVVTGNFKVSGNSIAVNGTACIGGNLDADNGLVGNNFYVDGDLQNLKIRQLYATKDGQTIDLGNQIYGNLFVKGNITAANGDQVINGNMTLKGLWTTNMSGYNAGVRGNLCVDSVGQIYFPNLDREFRASGNVWMASDLPIWTGNDNFEKYKRIVLGARDKDVYVKYGHPGSDYSSLRQTFTFTEPGDKYFGWADPGTAREQRRWGRNEPGGHGQPTVRVDEVYRDVFKNRAGLEGTGHAAKEGIHYLYNWTSSTPLVSMGNYTDNYWSDSPVLYVYQLNGERFYNSYDESSYKSVNMTGNQITGTPYCGKPCELNWWGGCYLPMGQKERARPRCGVSPWFKVDGDFRAFPATKPTELTCAESVKAHCDSLWEPTSDGCGGTKYLVPDALKTGISYFESYADRGIDCPNLDEVSVDGFDFGEYSNCYARSLSSDSKAANPSNTLYNDYLVVKITNKNIFKSPTGTLNGKFIFIFENDLHENMKLPTTDGDNSFVFMYFKDGHSAAIWPSDGSNNYNYFIYTKNDISNVLFNNAVLKGSLYAAVKDESTGSKVCAKVNDMTFNNGMEYNEDLMQSLTDARILCSNDGSACGGSNKDNPIASSASQEYNEDSDGGKDRYFISMAPQLGVSVESQYEAEERPPVYDDNTVTLQPSYLIMPRVIYLPSDPHGELADYYTVLPLNGASVSKADVASTVSCAGPIHSAGKLFNGSSLPQGVYKCEANPQNLSRQAFWVDVGNSQRGDAEVHFVHPYQDMGPNTLATVSVFAKAHGEKLTLAINCPEAPNAAWAITSQNDLYYKSELSSGTTCVYEIDENAEDATYELFTVQTTDATEGTWTFVLQPGQGFILGSPYNTQLRMSTTTAITRSDDVNLLTWCNETANVGKCPCAVAGACTVSELSIWPDCNFSGTWVEPEGTNLVVITNDANESWNVSTGGSGTIELKARNANQCVVVIPDNDENKLNRSELQSDQTYTLKAVAKARNHSIKIVFDGDVDGKTPVVDYVTGSRTGQCTYTGVGQEHACTVSVFDNEKIYFSIDSTNYNNSEFSYWQCFGSTCQSTPVTSRSYDGFKLSDDATVMHVHFGETDKHCFIDEFKDEDLRCRAGNVEYCIDRCEAPADGTCEGVEDARSVYTKSKWHLISGQLANIESYSGHISIKNLRNVTRGVNNKNQSIKVMSTVVAGLNGTLKALFRMPLVTSSYGRSSENITGSGFMLRSNATGTEYLMLNLYVNTSGNLEAQICTDAGSCVNGELKQNNNPIAVSTASMVMMSATLNLENKLVVSVFTGSNYYGSPSEYSYTFALASLTTSYMDRAHEYVGFSLADPNFKLYGIGWESLEYESDCWDTPPSVKCSFAAVAQDGIIELGTDVTPWVGHSGWFDSKECTPHYYYYNGSDACGGADENGKECTAGKYNFSTTSPDSGQHGYGDNIKTAKASLKCLYGSNTDEKWIMSTETEAAKAHCGMFWTGRYHKCTDNISFDKFTNMVLNAGTENFTEIVIQQGERYNLREAKLNIELENPDGNDVEVVLVSKTDFDNGFSWWGDAGAGNDVFTSRSVKMNGNKASFDVLQDFASGAEGFNPEKIRSIILKNHGSSAVTIKSISSSCKNAVGVTSCKAVYDNVNSWKVTAEINNITGATIVAGMKKPDQEWSDIPCGETNCAKTSATGENLTGTVTFTIGDNPYEYAGQSYNFKVSATNGSGSTAKTVEKECVVEPDPIGSISRECRVNVASVQAGMGMPQFQFSLNGCPTNGCPYKILYGTEASPTTTADSLVGLTKSGAIVKKTIAPMNTTDDPLEIGTYAYRVIPTDQATLNGSTVGAVPFTPCTATFAVTRKKEASEAVATECRIDGGPFRPGVQGTFRFTVNDGADINITGKNYQLELPGTNNVLTGNTGTGSERSVSFNAPTEAGTVTLKVWDKTSYEVSCTAELELVTVAPSSCVLMDNDSKFRAHFNSVCDNSACPWELKKTMGTGTTASSVATGYVDRNDVDVTISSYGLGIYTLWVNGVEQESCTATIGPKVECPSPRDFTVGTQVNLMMSSLSYCSGGCDYELAPAGTGTHFKDEENGGYTSVSDAITFTAPSGAQNNVEYVFTVKSHEYPSLSDNCTGTMNFVEGETCNQIDVTVANANVTITGDLQNGCAVINTSRVCTGGMNIKIYPCKQKSGLWNGVPFTLDNNDLGYVHFDANPSPSMTNRLEIADCPDAEIREIYLDGCIELNEATEVPVVTNCPDNDIIERTGSSMVLSLSHCNVVNGCSWSVSGIGTTITGKSFDGQITIPSASTDGDYTCTVTAENDYGEANECSFNITYDSEYFGNWANGVSLAPGVYRIQKCNGSAGNKTVQIGSNIENCLGVFSSTSNESYNQNNEYYCSGSADVSFPVTVTVPEGKYVSLNNCY